MKFRFSAILTFSCAATLLCGVPSPFGSRSALARQASDANEVVSPGTYSDLSYRMIGPSRGGRVTAVAGHASEPYTFYFGSTGGGVWKTTDAGARWDNVSDGFFDTGSIGSIDVADSDPGVIFVGTGSDGIRSNVIIGKGVYKSTDAGETWIHSGLRNVGQIGAVVIHPTNPEVVYVAALGNPFGPNPERGVYKTTDGGATWDHVLFVSDRTGAVDIELNPEDPDEVYAALWYAERKPWTIISGHDSEDGFYKSSDAGKTWKKVEDGLPGGLIGKIDLAVSSDDPSRIYALVEAVPEEEGLYRSNDRGDSWHLVTTQRGLMNRPFYYTNVDADPTDADVVYVNNEGFYKSTDGGKSFSRASTPHGDNHDMWINSSNPDIFIQSNDGGANVTLNGGRTWSTQDNQATAELYQVHVDDRFPYRVYAGQQDASTISVPSNRPRSMPGGSTAYWEANGGCETGPAVPRPGDPDIVYSNCKGRFGRYNRRTGQEQQYYVGAWDLYGRNPADLPYRFQRVAPITISPHDPDVIYHGSQYVHRTRDEGKTWETISPDLTAFRPERQMPSGGPITRDITGEEHYSTLYVIEESPVRQGVIWTGANDGPVFVTTDDGGTWTNVTPPDMPPEGRIQNIEPSPHAAGKAYVAGYRYLLGDFRPYIYRTEDFGASWTLLTDGANGIADNVPTRVVREDPGREGLLFAGTEFGMYLSFDDGGHWQHFQQNLPVTPVTDIKIVDGDLVLSTMGRSFWIMDDIRPLEELNEFVASEEFYFFASGDAFRMRTAGGGGSSDSMPEYASSGARLDYYLGSAAQGSMRLEILNEGGNVIRTVGGERTQAENDRQNPGMRGPFFGGRGAGGLSPEAGMHRFVWDLRVDGPEGENGRPARGPLVVPGTYTARLTIGDRSEEHAFRVQIDPRVAADGVTEDDMRAQFDLNMRVLELQGAAGRTVSRIEAAREALAGEEENRAEDADELLSGLDRLYDRLVTDNSDSYPPPMIVSQLGYLRGMISSADQVPGADAYTRYDELNAELSEVISEVDRMLSGIDIELPSR